MVDFSSIHVVFWCENGFGSKLITGYCNRSAVDSKGEERHLPYINGFSGNMEE